MGGLEKLREFHQQNPDAPKDYRRSPSGSRVKKEDSTHTRLTLDSHTIHLHSTNTRLTHDSLNTRLHEKPAERASAEAVDRTSGGTDDSTRGNPKGKDSSPD